MKKYSFLGLVKGHSTKIVGTHCLNKTNEIAPQDSDPYLYSDVRDNQQNDAKNSFLYTVLPIQSQKRSFQYDYKKDTS